MVNPENVIYNNLTDLVVLRKTDRYSISVFKMNGEVKYGIRWNGNESEESLGTPTAFGKPTWFILPQDVVEYSIRLKIK